MPRADDHSIMTSDTNPGLRFPQGEPRPETNFSDLIQEKHPIHQQLADTQSLLQTFFDLSPVVMGVIELEGDDIKFIFLNQATYRFYGFSKDLLGKTGRQMNLPSPLIDLWTSKMKQCAAQTSDIYFEYERDFSGKIKYFAVTMAPLGLGPTGNHRFSYVLQDHTTLAESEHRLSLSEQRFKLAQEHAVVGDWDFDVKKNTITWSDAMTTVFGISKDEVPKTLEEFSRLIHPEDLDYVVKSIELSMQKGEPHHIEFRVITKRGSEKWVEGRGSALFENGESTRMVGISIDITQRKEAEALSKKQSESLINLSKMSALGEMAGSIAHEINNPLTILRGTAAVIKKEIAKPNFNHLKLVRLSNEIDETCERVAKIIDGLRFFARDGSLDGSEVADINQIIQDTLGFCSEKFKKHGIELSFSRSPEPSLIYCKPVQISQVVLNILNNAYDAIEYWQDKRVNIVVQAQLDKITVRIEDSGPGIDSAIVEKIFKPFFTTKEAGKGTGLGLSIAKGIVEAHSGAIEYARSHEVSCFTIVLPKAGPL